ncbi:16S rRNA (guanine527-N7)-methyltransferase [Bathymodiolus platifrons methanotrophic gill symbiont]|uniref:16S rRNA (guanine(527)-N(7))-methyltransferase RsmG n=1 Tax=Bathymodiolus platifrons methanotrophic gill symbiont TaxID=113268 RepID=UPI000B40A2A8|nr:16S rRNA (guanine(527)-N(7))-methyltransferase RsmG [Bathymodiolus platifrons methanotrophic gill symbiont]MCK5869557.1 16S rRNA (guanine(527)-N(7))-methyltransferase RsmG [Methyloprofundus sp.]TXL21165.1 16S rRNA (guanine(527)-N(7))-methyltransferase RsmG [Methylococcaceae bacterium HT5]GAW86303.1 16S rRNA (guanine527-N7)-methyltransferase [Bathymodiolus platifrons methanotrophic gill symbiont]GFO77014.1 16S rRNA (guanine527-N7)-methyltransferase [Bathymodiolus platifrons methanotrophic gil
MDSSRTLLLAGIEQLGLEATTAQIDSLLNFVDLIEKWNKAFNLTAIRGRDEMLRLHILDSLAILPFITGNKIIDVGTGAGLPGIPLAIFMPNVQFTLLDSNSKKTRFVQQAILELQLQNVEVVHSRVEQLGRDGEYDAVLSRAFASLGDIMNLTEYLLQSEGVLIAMKGQVPELELKEMSRSYSVKSIVVPGIEAERCVLRINKI